MFSTMFWRLVQIRKCRKVWSKGWNSDQTIWEQNWSFGVWPGNWGGLFVCFYSHVDMGSDDWTRVCSSHYSTVLLLLFTPYSWVICGHGLGWNWQSFSNLAHLLSGSGIWSQVLPMCLQLRARLGPFIKYMHPLSWIFRLGWTRKIRTGYY